MQGCFANCCRRTGRRGARVAVDEDTVDIKTWTRDTLKTPITQLSGQQVGHISSASRNEPSGPLVDQLPAFRCGLLSLQTLLLTLVKVLVMMTVALVLGGDPRNTTYIWSYFKDMTLMTLLDQEVMLALLIQSFQQSIVTEPVARAVEALLFRKSK